MLFSTLMQLFLSLISVNFVNKVSKSLICRKGVSAMNYMLEKMIIGFAISQYSQFLLFDNIPVIVDNQCKIMLFILSSLIKIVNHSATCLA